MIKSLIFYILLFLWTIIAGIVFLPFLILPKRMLYRPAYIWIQGILILLNAICGLTYNIKGEQFINVSETRIIASKHQSAFETLLLFFLIPNAIFIHKYELFFIPIFGLYLKKIDMISINRSEGVKALKKMILKSKQKTEKGYSLIIFPEGTRKLPGSKPDYKSGIAGIYSDLNTKVLPVALDSGLFWPKNSFIIKSGKITIEFLSPIQKKLSKEIFLETLKDKIETKTNSLII